MKKDRRDSAINNAGRAHTPPKNKAAATSSSIQAVYSRLAHSARCAARLGGRSHQYRRALPYTGPWRRSASAVSLPPARGRDGQRGRRHQVAGQRQAQHITSDVQSDTTVTRTETDRLITGNKLSAIHGCYASALM